MKIALLLILFIIPSVSIAQTVKFPPTDSTIDPTKRFLVECKEATDSSNHFLILKDLKNGKRRKVLEFERHLDFSWAPDGNAFAVTDWGGSDFSSAWIGFPSDSSKQIKLEYDSPQVKENHHVYFEVLRWQNPSSTLLKVSGYGEHDSNGFEKYFNANLQGQLKEVKQQK